jgi:hypothetical protein
MPTQLLAPTDVAATTTANKVTVTWTDPNPVSLPASANKYEFIASIVTRDGLAPLPTPITKTVPAATLTADLDFGTGAGAPTAADFASSPPKYLVQVIAHATDVAFTDSVPGIPPYLDANVGLVIQIGSKTFTLTSTSSVGGIYKLPVSPANPLTISYQDDIKPFVQGLPGSPTLPSKWPNDTDITGELVVSKLAVDTTRKLFALDIAFDLNFTVFTGLTVQSVSLNVVRTDAVNIL